MGGGGEREGEYEKGKRKERGEGKQGERQH